MGLVKMGQIIGEMGVGKMRVIPLGQVKYGEISILIVNAPEHRDLVKSG